MPKFVIHVIDDASQHEKFENGEFELVQGIVLEDSACDILRSDAFYLAEAEDALGAVAILANVIKLKNEKGEEITLAQGITRTHKKVSTTDFSSEESTPVVDDTRLKIITLANSEFYMASCQVPMKNDSESWVELHKVYFYVLAENKIVEV